MKSSSLLLSAAAMLLCVEASGQDFVADPERIEARIQTLGQFGANPKGGVTRVAFSDADLEGRAYIRELMIDADLEVRIDPAGNLIGRRAGGSDELPPIMIGSHIDSVPDGGNYDGPAGVIGALEIIEIMNDYGLQTRYPIEVVNFVNQSGGKGGSRAMIGSLTSENLESVSHSGLTIAEGIRRLGGDPERLDEAIRERGDITAYLELHVEQGATLHQDDIDIGIVEAVVGTRWWQVTVSGIANHSGTTPMNRRTDALVTAAELTLSIDRIATEIEGRQVATVGEIQAFPGSPNVIPGEVRLSLEVRDLNADKIQRVYDLIHAEASLIAHRRGSKIEFSEVDLAAPPVSTAPTMRTIIEASANQRGLSSQRMPSWSGHDLTSISSITPAGMILIPSANGISHSPYEFTAREDIANGANVLFGAVMAIDAGTLDRPPRRVLPGFRRDNAQP